MFRVLCNEKIFLQKIVVIFTHTTLTSNYYRNWINYTIPIIITFLIISFLFLKHTISKIIFNNEPYLTDPQILILTILFISITPFAPGPNFFNNYISIIYYLPIGFLLCEFSFLNSLLLKNKTKKVE